MHPRCHGPALLLYLVAALVGAAWIPRVTLAARVPALRPSQPHPQHELWLAVRVNSEAMDGPAHMLKRDKGSLYASVEDLVRWRIRLPDRIPLRLRGKDYLPLDAIDGLSHRVDERTQTLLIEGRPEVFTPSRVDALGNRYARPDPPSTGGFLNYDLEYQRQEDRQRLSGLFELGLFNAWGIGTSSFLRHDLGDDDGLTRLETTWTHDEPGAMRSLRIGDSIGRSGAWGRSVRFGGVQWGSDFALRPDYIPFPRPSIGGEAVLPSTADLYVNNALRLSQRVSPGPFAINEVPVVTGSGEVRLVVRDVLGREHVISAPYYVSPGLLREGLHDYTYEAGFPRRDFAVENDDYGSFFAAGTHRLGLSDRLTGELRGELSGQRQAAGMALAYKWGIFGIVDAAVAASNGPEATGGLLSLGFEHQGRDFSFGLRTQLTSDHFTQLGASRHYPTPRRLTRARANLATKGGGSTFVSYLHQSGPTQPDVDLLSAGYSANLFGDYYLSLFAVHDLNGGEANSLGINITRALGARTTASTSWTRQDSGSTPAVQVQRSLPPGSGFGYRLRSAGGPNETHSAQLLAQSEIGTYSAEAARANGLSGQRLSAAGGVAFLGGGMHLSRRLDESFAVVKVGEYPEVPVLADNQEVARTDSSGAALVPSLRAYQANAISIRQDALPLDAEVGALRLSVTPRRRSGSLLAFPVRPARGALITIHLEDDSPLPPGAVVSVAGSDKRFPVARRGQAYVTGLARENSLEASWKGRHCSLRVTLPPDAGPLPVLGPLLCRGVKP